MTRQRAFLAVASLLALGLLWLVLGDGGTEPRAVESPAPQARAVAPSESALDAATREVPPSELATPAVEDGRVVSSPPEFEVETPEPELAHLVGRFLLPEAPEPFVKDAFVGGVLVDQEHPLRPFGDDVGAAELADHAEDGERIGRGLDAHGGGGCGVGRCCL